MESQLSDENWTAYKELPVMLTDWIDQDRKLTGLKLLQGMIMDEGC